MLNLRLFITAVFMLCLIWACSNDSDSSDNNHNGNNGEAGAGGMAGVGGSAGSSPMGGEAGGDAEGGAAPMDATPRTQLLNALQANVYLPTYESFVNSSTALKEAAVAWDAEPSDENLENLKEAWKTAMNDWQKAEVMQVGPAGAAERRVGGMDYRDRIYSFPVVNSCRVDQELVRGAFTESEWVENAQFNVRGLDAMEYLIFGMTDENTCPSVSGINRNGDWSALQATSDELTSRRTAYARVLAEGIVADAETLAAAWQGTDGTFGHAFVNASEPFSSQKEVLDQVFAGMFYADKFIKDLKLAKPAGITDDCANNTCPDSVESKWAEQSKTNLLANLEAFKMLFLGGADDSSYGFDDLLIEEGAPELADRMVVKIDAAIAAVSGIESSVEAQLTADEETVRAGHAAVRDITDDLKTQFVTVLNLSVPQEGAGDND